MRLVASPFDSEHYGLAIGRLVCDDGDGPGRIEVQRLERRQAVQLGARQRPEVERLPERDPARGHAVGGADVEHLQPLALIEAAGELFGGDLGQRRVGHAVGSVAGRE